MARMVTAQLRIVPTCVMTTVLYFFSFRDLRRKLRGKKRGWSVKTQFFFSGDRHFLLLLNLLLLCVQVL